MSQHTELTAGPAANHMDAELTLVACDGTQFSVHASQLERLSDVFRSMLEMPQPEHLYASAADNTVHLSEDATTLRALLDLTATSVNVASRINSLSLSQLSRLMTAADKYDIPAVRPLVESCVQRRTDDLDPWENPWPLLVFVKRFGFVDLEASVRPKLLQSRLDAVLSDADLSYLSGADVDSIMLERRRRVDQFCDALTSERWEAPFSVYNRGQYGRCPFCTKDFSNNVNARDAWSAVTVAAIDAYDAEPSVEALLQNAYFLEGTSSPPLRYL
ncbi:hypothetical protein EXIGLDRAFT_764236 [Exidia glandulosa HHB12029]|uniref:Uncharacterized protein n=1 Tax=Exidia glandulosa HHB12029 TaxID=1314781 RepID=A0A165L9Y5_EXIGL|nr:hypothetical protein EXIGLDRAFT_764236 [Exidia glandulosa HHB12029]